MEEIKENLGLGIALGNNIPPLCLQTTVLGAVAALAEGPTGVCCPQVLMPGAASSPNAQCADSWAAKHNENIPI